ncbi:MAG: hypothetical protein U9R48_00490 [Chloroflexota bacterium]|nr:hypothetical protein [Chloroflexota bacterium]
MSVWLLLFVVTLGSMLLGAIPLLISAERWPGAHEEAIKCSSHAPSWLRLNRGLLCLLPLVVYLLLWSSVAGSLSWSGIMVGGVLSVIVAAVVLYMGRGKGGEDHKSDTF